ncbi:MAG: hypothetical protein A4E48_00874 [Methanosaeta sp. PtaU1.Bin060]|nr:MAG: hypothetical protein A4E48_00874 [Methanosaeta sp. PtaU1.Bin060]
MIENDLIKSVGSLFNWVKKEGYYGWDPYDALHGLITTKMCMGNPYLEMMLIQIGRISPINMRPILKIQKGIDLKGCALFARAYAEMCKTVRNKIYLTELCKMISFLNDNSLKDKYGYECWSSHYFPYTGVDKSRLTPSTPDVIGTSQSIIALVEGYMITGDEHAKNAALDAWNFLSDKFIESKTNKIFIKYTLGNDNRITINASAQGLEAGCYILKLHQDRQTKNICQKLSRFLVSMQGDDGSWKYSIYDDGRVRNQLDFHQGFILDALVDYLKYADSKAELASCIENGIRIYKEKMFLRDGRSYYRYPAKYPIDIHNQAQGIITFAKYSVLDPQYSDFANQIAKWTITNMQDRSGYFYYHKWPLIANKIPYMRWSQAWMMLALATLMEHLRDEYRYTNST